MKSTTTPATECGTNSPPPFDTSPPLSGTQHGLGNSSVPPWSTDGDRALSDVARREHILAVQLKAHRHCSAQLADERARFEAERETAITRATQAAVARVREELAVERQEFEQRAASQCAEIERRQAELAQREAELAEAHAQLDDERQRSASAPPHANMSGRGAEPSPEATLVLCDLAKKAVDFAAMVDAVTHVQRQLAEARSMHEAMHKRHSEALQEREEALAAREAAVAERIATAESQVEADRQRVVQAQQETARLEQEVKERRTDLMRRQAELTTAEQEMLGARQEAVGMLKAAARDREELDAATARLKVESEALARAQQEQVAARSELDQRGAEIARQSTAFEETKARVAREAEEMRQQSVALQNERAEFESRRTAFAAEETALAQRMRAFDERQRKFRESVTSLIGE